MAAGVAGYLASPWPQRVRPCPPEDSFPSGSPLLCLTLYCSPNSQDPFTHLYLCSNGSSAITAPFPVPSLSMLTPSLDALLTPHPYLCPP